MWIRRGEDPPMWIMFFRLLFYFVAFLGDFFAFFNSYLVVFGLLLPKTEENKLKYMQEKDLKIFFKMSKCE